ncbi:hypothetical protein ACFLW8_02540 [Chloroflexota bacterium]
MAGIGLYLVVETSRALQSTGMAISDVKNTISETQNRLEGISETLERTNYRLDEVEGRAQRVETIAKWSWTVWSLQSREWQYYLTEMQKKASNHNPIYVEPLPSDKFALTDEGRNLLDTKQREDISAILRVNTDMSTNNVILMLDIRDLDAYASKKNVSLEVLMGVITTHIQEIRKIVK